MKRKSVPGTATRCRGQRDPTPKIGGLTELAIILDRLDRVAVLVSATPSVLHQSIAWLQDIRLRNNP